jgi:hypothetical protein
MTYDTMFSDELVKEYARVSYRDRVDSDQQKKLAAILAVIRKTVVKELSVGVVTTYTTLDGPDGNEHMRTDWHIEGMYPDDGTFYLVPKKTHDLRHDECA